MGRTRILATKAGIALIVATALAGASIAYAVTRFTAGLPASFVAIEATYALSILHADGQPLGALAFGEIVQGDRGFASFGVRNDGNTATRLGFRIRTGDGQGDIYVPTARCQLPNRDRPRHLPYLQKLPGSSEGHTRPSTKSWAKSIPTRSEDATSSSTWTGRKDTTPVSGATGCRSAASCGWPTDRRARCRVSLFRSRTRQAGAARFGASGSDCASDGYPGCRS